MKKQASPSLTISLILCGAIPVSAQLTETLARNPPSAKAESLESADRPSFAADKLLSGVYQLPVVRKTQADLLESAPVFVSQDMLTLTARGGAARALESVLDLSVLREPSAYRTADTIKVKVSDEQVSGIRSGLAELSAAYKQPAQASDSAHCPSVALSVEQRVKLDPSTVLGIVESEISANPNCACEIVKIAIKASGADASLVGDITEVAITSAPESMRMISQCAIAAMPEALAAVQAVLAKLDPNSGDVAAGSKDAKAAIASEVTPPAEPPNPLDLPPPSDPPPPPPNPPVVTDPNP